MVSSPRPDTSAAAIAAVVTALALVLRVVWPTHVDWEGDFALHTLRAVELARGERLDLLVGFQTTSGAHLPALFHHLLGAAAFLGAGPVGLTCLVAASNVVAVLLLVTAGRRAFGAVPAVVGGLLLAVGPVAVLRARAIRNETLLVPLLVVLLLALVRAWREPRSRAAGVALGTAITMAQLHLSSLFVLVPASLPLGVALWRAPLRRSAPGLALGLTLAAPFLVHELGGGFPEARAVLTRGLKGQDLPGRPNPVLVPSTPADMVARVADLMGTSGFSNYVGERAWSGGLGALPATVRHAVPLAALAAQAAVALGLLLSLAGRAPTARGVHRGIAVLTLASLGVYQALGVLAREEYLFVLLPCFCLSAGVAVAWVGAAARRLGDPRRTRAVRAGLCAAVVLAAATSCAAITSSFAWLAREGGAPEARYGTTYAVKRAAVEWLLEHGYAIGAYPSFTYPMTLDLAYRGASPAQHARFAPFHTVVPFWRQPMTLPVPRGSLRTASIIEGAPPVGVTPAARFGPVFVIADEAPRR